MKVIRKFVFSVLFTGMTSSILATGGVASFQKVFNTKENHYYSVPDEIVLIIYSYSVLPYKWMKPKRIIASLRKELADSVRSGGEPTYIESMQNERNFDIEALIEEKNIGIEGREAWIKHAHNILNVMYATCFYIHVAILDACTDFSNGDDSISSIRSYGAYRLSNRVAWRDAQLAALKAGRSAAYFNGYRGVYANSLAANAVKLRASTPSSELAAQLAAESVIEGELEHLKLKDPAEEGKFSYRIAENVVLISFMKMEREIFDAAYNASREYLDDQNRNDLFSKTYKNSAREDIFSPTAWEKFRNDHFGKLNKQAFDYLAPYLNRIDLIVENKVGDNPK